MIDCFNIKTSHLFPGDILASQYRLRYRLNIERQEWGVPNWNEEFEFDSYDTPATVYFAWRDEHNVVRGCQRLCSTERPYMIEQAFPFLVTNTTLPKDPAIWEGSRICVDTDLDAALRKRIIFELAVAYMEYALEHNIEKIIGVMLPAYWKSVYMRSGWDPFFYGESQKLSSGERVRAGGLPCNEPMLEQIRRTTGIYERIINYGIEQKRLPTRISKTRIAG